MNSRILSVSLFKIATEKLSGSWIPSIIYSTKVNAKRQKEKLEEKQPLCGILFS